MRNKVHLYYIWFIIFSFLCISSGSAGTYVFKYNEADSISVASDGPYVLYEEDGTLRVIAINSQGMLKDTLYRTLPEDFVLSVADSKGIYSFQVPLHSIQRPSWRYKQPHKVFVMSDPHGDLDCFVNLLQGNGVVDKHLNWSFGSNHLMVVGDIFDRGDDVVQIFWLVYKLEQEAELAGGHVSFLLGNHEPMVLANDLRYCTIKYHTLAEKLGMPYARLFGENTELGRWLATRNTIEIIGRDLYVHAGLSEEFYEWNLDIPEVNEEMSKALFMGKKARKELSELTAFLYGSNGPIWYRGLVRNEEKYNPIPADTLKRMLKRYKVRCLIIGHTIHGDVSIFYDKRVIDVNVNNVMNREKGLGRGLLIENKKYMIVGDNGVQFEL